MNNHNNSLTMTGATFEWIRGLKLPLIGHLRLHRQIRILFLFMLASLLFGGFFIWLSISQARVESIRAQIVGDALMHTQRMGKAAPSAIHGDTGGFKQLQDSRNKLTIDLNLLMQGGDFKNYHLDGAQPADLSALGDSEKIWSNTDKAAATILASQKELIAFDQTAKKLTATAPVLFKLVEEIAASKLPGNGSSTIDAGQLLMSTMRIERNVNAFVAAESVNSEAALLLKKEMIAFNELLDGLLNDSDTEIQQKLTELKTAFGHYQQSVLALLDNLPVYIDAKKAAQLLTSDNEDLRLHLMAVQTNYRNRVDSTSTSDYLLLFGLAMTLLAASSIALVFVQDDHHYIKEANSRRALADIETMQAQKRESEAKQANDENQLAILRLMNELQEIADGDLTIRATVADDITGAIADSVNYMVEELGNLVGRVIAIAEQVALASGRAEEVSAALLSAAQKHTREINETSQAILTLIGNADEAQQQVIPANVAHSIQQIISITAKTQDDVQQTMQSIHDLAELTQELKNAVSRFRVTV